ncbi:MAG TPA: galactokinase, partial [Proteobacteria bacterium]|nr:galactokinase [Pseudomonadota bacterium]
FWVASELGLKTQGRYYITSEIPLGSGLSSSAAFEMALLAAIFELNGHGFDRKELALLGRKVENEFVGVQSGIMDQMISALGKAGKLLLIDCTRIEYRYVDWPDSDASLWIIHTGITRTLAQSEFNKRREQCEAALALINARTGNGFELLAHVPEELVWDLKDELGDVLFRRARHVVTEVKRVYAFVEALERNDLKRAGELLYEAHASSRDNYETSCAELDLLVELAREAGALGGRLVGAGFGGAAVFIVPDRCEPDFVRIPDIYRKRTGRQPRIWKVYPSDGLRVDRV